MTEVRGVCQCNWLAGTHLVHRDNVSKPDPEVVAHCLVHADFGFLHCVVHEDNADGVLAFFDM